MKEKGEVGDYGEKEKKHKKRKRRRASEIFTATLPITNFTTVIYTETGHLDENCIASSPSNKVMCVVK